jgi:hypothetical protein
MKERKFEAEYIGVQDVADILDIGFNKALNLVKTKGFPAIKIGNTYRVSVSGFEKWQKENMGSKIVVTESVE